ncbi:MAG: hypothetical protein HFG26_09680 [Provencibacterium sp.]|nr:hypothetical protein [Provencibacterium sp.]
MEKIKRDFMRREIRRLALCAAGLAACLFVLLRCYPAGISYGPRLLLGAAAVTGCAALRSALYVRAGMNALTDNDAFLLDREYAEPHPVYKVWQGEAHLLPSFIVCRSRGRLLFIPLDKIERVEQRFDRAGLQKIPFAKFIMDTGRSISVGFPLIPSKDSDAVFGWIAERIGSEKVKRW